MPTVKSLFKEQIKNNLRKRKAKLSSVTGSNILIKAIDQQLDEEIQLPGEVRGQYKKYFEMEARSEIKETVVAIGRGDTTKGWAVKIDEEKHLVMYYNNYRGNVYLDFTIKYNMK